MPTGVKTRALGKNGPQVPALGFGLMGLSCKTLFFFFFKKKIQFDLEGQDRQTVRAKDD